MTMYVDVIADSEGKIKYSLMLIIIYMVWYEWNIDTRTIDLLSIPEYDRHK